MSSLLLNVINFLAIALPILFSVAYLTLFERKVLAAAGRRLGPNVVGFMGLLQPLADGVKLLMKESIVPTSSNKSLYLLAPIVTFALSIVGYGVLPFTTQLAYADVNCGLLFTFAVSSLSVYGVVFSGWASNSKYAFLGSLRSAAQMISYEVSIGLTLLNLSLFARSLNLSEIVLWQVENIPFFFPLFPVFLLFFISALAETNRPPFDLPEAEGELVAGYNVEYSAAGFALFFIGEYANIILMSSLTAVFFFGGFSPFKAVFFMFVFIWVRAAYPRFRYDQLMRLGWKVFLPISLAIFTLVWLLQTSTPLL
jgi:NADH-quinone oxidoreductase subunit H